MREIKFRGFSKTLNKWIIGVPYFSEGNWWILVDENTKSDDIGTGSYFVDKNSIGQYTGLKDKNEIEIYNKDIIKDGSRLWIVEISSLYGVVLRLLKDKKITRPYVKFEKHLIDDFEVIGNIYENPELI